MEFAFSFCDKCQDKKEMTASFKRGFFVTKPLKNVTSLVLVL